jgi:hypothetical protein
MTEKRSAPGFILVEGSILLLLDVAAGRGPESMKARDFSARIAPVLSPRLARGYPEFFGKYFAVAR